MKCLDQHLTEDEVFERIDKYLNDELSAKADRDFTEHLLDCSSCYKMAKLQKMTLEIAQKYGDEIFLKPDELAHYPNSEEAQSKLAIAKALKKGSLKRKGQRRDIYEQFARPFGGIRSILESHPAYLKNLEKVLKQIGRIPGGTQKDEIITYLTLPSVSMKQKERIIADIQRGTRLSEIAKTYGITKASVRGELRNLDKNSF